MLGSRVLLVSTIFVVLAHVVRAADPDPLQDFCVGFNDSNASVFVNGKFCKNPQYVTPQDFFFSGVDQPGNITSPLGSKLTQVFHNQLKGLNHLGIAMVRIDLGPQGLNPPHEHPRSAEILFVTEGSMYVGFIASNPANPNQRNKLFAKTLHPGDVYIFPRGTIHFQYNVGHTPAVAFASFNSQNPGVVTIASSVFGSDPPVYPAVLAKAFQMDERHVEYLQSLTWIRNN